MEIVGKVVSNAVVRKLKDDRKVVNFSIAINDYYKPKGSEKATQTTLFINCSYWLNTTIAERLTKGAVVELNGRLYLNAYNNMEGEAQATLHAHVNSIKVHLSASKGAVANTAKSEPLKAAEDLPF